MSELPGQPPDHILKLLEPADRKPRRSPIRDPQDPDHWWRVLPNANSGFHKQPLGTIFGRNVRINPRDAIDITLRHFDFLDAIGIKNPNLEMYLGEMPGRKKARLFSLNEHVTGVNNRELRHHPDARPMFRLIGSRLIDYANWVQDNERYILFDIARPTQYMYGTTPSVQTPETFLVDTDPFLDYADYAQLGAFRASADEMVHH